MATRVTLFHNPTAGLEKHPREELLQALDEKGFQTTYVDTKRDDYFASLREPGELVVVAGGDGTVRKILKHLLHRNIPIGLLPLGTANNIASSLGIAGAASDIIASWDLARRKAYDVGVVSSPEGDNIFFESAGFGIFPRLIRQHEKDKSEGSSRKKELKKALQHEKEILNSTGGHECTIQINGQQLTGTCLLVEVMNIRLAGPNMDLAPEADPGDGLLDVVVLREDEREKFETYITNCMRDKGNVDQWQVRRAKEIQVEWGGMHFHIDDEVFKGDSPVHVSISLIREALEFLVN